MERFFKKVRVNLIVCIALSVMFVAGIPMVVLGALDLGHKLYIFIFGIAFVVGGFYGMPFFWLNYAKLVKRKQMLILIRQGVCSYAGIAQAMEMKEKYVRKHIYALIRGDYISADLVTDAPIYIQPEIEEVAKAVVCNGCGVSFVKTDDVQACPYCGKYN